MREHRSKFGADPSGGSFLEARAHSARVGTGCAQVAGTRNEVTVITLHPPLTLSDVIYAVCEASSSSQEAARVMNHLLSTGQVRLRDSLAATFRVAAQEAL